MNYNQLASHNPKIVRICHTMAADMQNKLHRRPMNGNKSRTRPAPICAPRGEDMNYNYIHHINRYAPIGYAIVRTNELQQPTTRATAASPDTRRRHGPYIAPTAAPA